MSRAPNVSDLLPQKFIAEALLSPVLMTFYGYGAGVPRGWRMVASLRIENGDLTMWIKESL